MSRWFLDRFVASLVLTLVMAGFSWGVIWSFNDQTAVVPAVVMVYGAILLGCLYVLWTKT